MTVTQEFIEQVAEALNVLGDALENSAGYPRGAEVITDETEITDTLSLPGVLYDADLRTHDEAQALKYVQIPWSVLSTLLTTMQDAVAEAYVRGQQVIVRVATVEAWPRARWP